MTAVLLVDDDTLLADTLAVGLRKNGYSVDACTSSAAAEITLARSDFDVVVTDLNMQGGSGIELCRRIAGDRADLPVIVLTAFGSMETAVAAIRAGAYDFISKPIALEALAIAIDRAANHRRLGEEIKRLRSLSASATFDEIVASSAAMREALEMVARVAQSEATVLVTGESGTGKEVIARALHGRSRRRDAPFVAVNCAAVPEALLESELFGHVRGAFTDARTSRVGLFEQANGGTLLLDEIGDMPLSIQPKLLRALQERRIRPIGGSEERPVDVRVVASTNCDLELAIEEGRFREDLFYRINVVHVPLPPLRARGADILPLAHAFISQLVAREGGEIRGISRGAAERLLAYPWPGNVRELRNCIERAIALARFDQIAVDDLPEKVRDHRANHVVVVSEDPSELVSLEEVERRYVARVMDLVGGNKSAAARILGLDRKRLYRMLERLGVDPS